VLDVAVFWIIAVIVMVIVMISASFSDWKKREVSDIHWLILGITGIIIFTVFAVKDSGFKWQYLCLAAGSVLILVDILWEREGHVLSFYLLMAILFAVAIFYDINDPIIVAWASVPACYIIFMGMYIFGIVRGGADAKCLITLSMLFPMYPAFSSFPLISVPSGQISQIFVFSISVLFFAAMLTGLTCIYFVLVNVKNGDKCRRMLLGYKMDLEKAKVSHVWPIEDFVEGKLVPCGIPENEQEVFVRLTESGCKRVWITPMIPFIIPMTISAIFIAFIGNPLFLIG